MITAQSQGLGAPTASVTNCGGCQLVADVAGIVWYSEVFQLAAATIVNAIYVANQTSSSGRIVATSRRTITATAGQVTIRPNSLGGGPELQVQYASTYVIANATLYVYSFSSQKLNECLTESGFHLLHTISLLRIPLLVHCSVIISVSNLFMIKLLSKTPIPRSYPPQPGSSM